MGNYMMNSKMLSFTSLGDQRTEVIVTLNSTHMINSDAPEIRLMRIKVQIPLRLTLYQREQCIFFLAKF